MEAKRINIPIITDFNKYLNLCLITDFIYSSVSLITPKIAEEMLSTSLYNRKINRSRVSQYKEAMEADEWYISDAIKFDSDGHLIDGHHRLIAISKCTKAIPCLIITGLPKESIKGIDLGQSRTLAQVSGFLGEPTLDRYKISIGRIIEFGPSTGGNQKKLSYNDAKRLLVKYEGGINFAYMLGGHRKYTPATVGAVIARAYYSQDQTRLREFVSVLISGSPESPCDWGASRLRNYIDTHTTNGRVNVNRDILYWLAESAVYHFCKKNPIKLLKAASTELFQINEEIIKL